MFWLGEIMRNQACSIGGKAGRMPPSPQLFLATTNFLKFTYKELYSYGAPSQLFWSRKKLVWNENKKMTSENEVIYILREPPSPFHLSRIRFCLFLTKIVLVKVFWIVCPPLPPSTFKNKTTCLEKKPVNKDFMFHCCNVIKKLYNMKMLFLITFFLYDKWNLMNFLLSYFNVKKSKDGYNCFYGPCILGLCTGTCVSMG